MGNDSVPQERICNVCVKPYPLTSEYWYKDNTAKFGLAYRCKSCAKSVYRKWGKDNHDYELSRHKEWRQSNPDKAQATVQRRRAKRKNLPVKFTANDWQRALDYFGHCCAVCGKAADFFTVLAMDHWIPLDRGGATVADNVVPLCHPKPGIPAGEPCCNSSKGHKLPEVWLADRFGKRKSRVILKRIKGYFDWLKSQ